LGEFRKEAACGAAGLPGRPLEKEETEGKAFRFSIANRGDSTPIEHFLEGVRGSESGIRRLLTASAVLVG
jgi:hypothetical protein